MKRTIDYAKDIQFWIDTPIGGLWAQSTPGPTPTPFTGTPHSVIIDTDMAADELIVIEEEGMESGRTTISENGTPVRVAVNADNESFEQFF